MFFLFCVKSTHREGDMAICWLQFILDLNLWTNTHERDGIWTRAPSLTVLYRTNEWNLYSSIQIPEWTNARFIILVLNDY